MEKARYPLPAIVIRVGYQPTGKNECFGIPYVWVCSKTLLWTFWKDLGLVVEKNHD